MSPIELMCPFDPAKYLETCSRLVEVADSEQAVDFVVAAAAVDDEYGWHDDL